MVKRMRVTPFLFEIKEPGDRLLGTAPLRARWTDKRKTVLDAASYSELERAVRERLRTVNDIPGSPAKYEHLAFGQIENLPETGRMVPVRIADGRYIVVPKEFRPLTVGIDLTDEARKKIPDTPQMWSQLLRTLMKFP